MTSPAENNALLVWSRPRFEVDGRHESRLDVDLVRLEASEDEEGMARLEAVFLNWDRVNQTDEPGFRYFDGEILSLGREVTVRARVGCDDDVIFNGVITAIEGVYLEQRPPEVILRAEDRLQWLRMRRRSRFFEQQSDADMVRAVVGDHGLGDDVSTSGPTHTEFLQINQSELAFLRARARANDARLALEDGQVVFRPRHDDGDEPIALTRENQLIRFRVSADLSHQRTEVRVHGYSVADKEAIHEVAGADAVSGEANGGATGPDILAGIESEAAEDLHLEVPATAEEANALATSLMQSRARRFVSGQGVTNGTPGMHVGTRVDLVDLGEWFSGVYHVACVRHTYDYDQGFRTHFRAERVELRGSV